MAKMSIITHVCWLKTTAHPEIQNVDRPRGIRLLKYPGGHPDSFVKRRTCDFWLKMSTHPEMQNLDGTSVIRRLKCQFQLFGLPVENVT